MVIRRKKEKEKKLFMLLLFDDPNTSVCYCRLFINIIQRKTPDNRCPGLTGIFKPDR
jgi:hypothetical protein